MRIKLENITKIDKADVVVDGITVIAGENSSGKSTVGRVLYSIFDCGQKPTGEMIGKYRRGNRCDGVENRGEN